MCTVIGILNTRYIKMTSSSSSFGGQRETSKNQPRFRLCCCDAVGRVIITGDHIK